MSEISIRHVGSISLEGDTVCVKVRHEVDENSFEVEHEQEVGDRFIVSVVAEAVEEAIAKANAVLAGWDMATRWEERPSDAWKRRRRVIEDIIRGELKNLPAGTRDGWEVAWDHRLGSENYRIPIAENVIPETLDDAGKHRFVLILRALCDAYRCGVLAGREKAELVVAA